jgi:hypothetical protein
MHIVLRDKVFKSYDMIVVKALDLKAYKFGT